MTNSAHAFSEQYDDSRDVWRISYTVEGSAFGSETGDLVTSVTSGLIDKSIGSRRDFKPEVVYNNPATGQSVLAKLLSELDSLKAGDTFSIAVAFINQGGIALLENSLDRLREIGVKGRLITGTYLAFNDPQAFETLLSYQDVIETRVYDEIRHRGLHAKGYYFSHGKTASMLIGSSNLTPSALKGNLEWNLSVTSGPDGSLVDSFMEAFEAAWNAPTCTGLSEGWIEKYRNVWRGNLRNEVVSFGEQIKDGPIGPNGMQKKALAGLAEVHREQKPRALVISATGTGKTYLAALDVRKFEPKPRKVLFVVHRERIARDAMKSFKRVLGDAYSYGILAGGERQSDATCLFSTIQTLSKEESLRTFARDEFGYIIIDEVHRAGASSYEKILDYFKPKFLLGMSATPERNDKFDIFALFNHTIAYEIRLQEALDSHLVAPFEYFGVSKLNDLSPETLDKRDYTEEARAIAEESKKRGYSGPRLKGLIFCSKNEESAAISDELNKLGYHTIALSGASSDSEREDAMKRLEQPEPTGALDFIVSVDIFNEGVDIPTVNQVIMVRPTDSAIVFVQQLGRGLRVKTEKEYVTIIDFVSNYSNNYNIPIALYGERSGQKESLRRLVSTGGSFIPGPTTIQFDKVAKERVLKSINEANFSKVSFIRSAYQSLCRRLDHIPSLEEIRESGEASPYLIFQNNSLGCYHTFLEKYEPRYHVKFDETQMGFLRFISCELADGKRTADLVALRCIIEGGATAEEIARQIRTRDDLVDVPSSGRDYLAEAQSAFRVLSLAFYSQTKQEKNLPLCVQNGERWDTSEAFASSLQDKAFAKQVDELISFGLHTYELDYSAPYGKTRLQINKRYSRKDACRLLCWKKNEEGTINGYKFRETDDDWVIFVTYHKASGISASTQYRDEFLDRNHFRWYSQSNRSLGSRDYSLLSAFGSQQKRIHLFVKKEDSEGSDHYYLGTIRPIVSEIAEETIENDKGKEIPILMVPMAFDRTVDAETYHYLRE